MTQKPEIETFCPTSQHDWRQLLMENHRSKKAVWLLQHKKSSGKPSISWSDSVDEALCFGWIDSVRKSVDEYTFIQFYGKRKPKSVWSKINKAKVEHLIKEGLMMPAGYESIEIAKQNGSWVILDEVEDLGIPVDLEEALTSMPEAKGYFSGLSRSVRKAILQWLILAKRAETRQKRIIEITELAAQKQRPKQFR